MQPENAGLFFQIYVLQGIQSPFPADLRDNLNTIGTGRQRELSHLQFGTQTISVILRLFRYINTQLLNLVIGIIQFNSNRNQITHIDPDGTACAAAIKIQP